jgi:hypothetical protein
LPIETPEVKPVFDHPQTPPDSQPIWHAQRLDVPPPTALLGVAPADRLVDPQRNTVALAQVLVGSLAWPLRGIAPVLDDVAGFIHPPVG